MRLFVAIELVDAVIRAADAVIGELRSRVARFAPRARVTWVAPERLHVTLVFIGRAGEHDAAAIADAMRPPLVRAPMAIEVAGLGAFPGRGSPRALWIGVEAGRGDLVNLQREVADRLARIGISPEGRAFHPHVTIARVREPAGLRAAPLVEGLAATKLGAFQVEAVTLFESRLSPRGPAYVPLQRTHVMAPDGGS